jgi:hypothetical protein
MPTYTGGQRGDGESLLLELEGILYRQHVEGGLADLVRWARNVHPVTG